MAWVSIARVAELAEGGGRAAAWLTPRERRHLDGLLLAKRRRDWLAGRIAAKELARRRHRLEGPDSFQRIDVDAVADGPERGRPRYQIGGAAGPYGLSISHSSDRAVAALGHAPGERVGVDIEQPVDAKPGFDEIVLSAPEREALRRLDAAAARAARTRIFTAKEALLKALGTGLRVPFVHVAVRLAPATAALDDRPFEVLAPDGELACLRDVSLSAGTFRLGDAFGAWVVLSC
jgi:4'-phosphopantetheinyl transferase EntD